MTKRKAHKAKFDVEYTDTFGGEANYCWVKRKTIIVNEPVKTLALMRAAKAAVGISNLKGRKDDYGDTIDFRPYGTCTVLFIIPHDCGNAECKCGEEDGKNDHD